MTLSTQQITVGTAVTLIAGPDEMAQRIIVHNDESSQQIFIGDSAVSTTTGLHIDGKEEQTFVLNPGEALYAVVSTGTNKVSVMTQRQ